MWLRTNQFDVAGHGLFYLAKAVKTPLLIWYNAVFSTSTSGLPTPIVQTGLSKEAHSSGETL